MLRWLKWPGASDSSSIGHYRITRKLGAGGMGVVYAAEDERLGRTVALKMLSDKTRDLRARERLRREAQAAARVNHPNICQVHEIGEHAGEPYIVMELLEGESLERRLSLGALPVRDATRITLELLNGLGALHAHGLLHRDLKPSNVFLTPHCVKLLDFGLVRREFQALAAPVGAETSLTATGMLVGTPRYMSPEQIAGRELDARSDLFAVGAILYEMLTGQHAFGGTSRVEVLHSILYAAPSPAHGSAGLVAVYEVAAKALAKPAAERHASAEAMAEALRAAAVVVEADTRTEARHPAGDMLGAARRALARRSWTEAFDLLTKAEAAGVSLDADDLEALGEAALWAGHPQESIDARQRAFAAHTRAGRPRRAALVAMALVANYSLRLNHAVAGGWLSTARRLLEQEPEGVEHGYLAFTETMALTGQREFGAALARARQVRDYGRRHGDPDLQVLGLALEGFALARQGRMAEGMALLDEAMTSTLGGQTGPFATAMTYCRTLGVCVDAFDYRRALEWTRAVESCSVGSQPGGFAGDCRTHKVVLLKVRGEWARAEDEARAACAEADTFCLNHSAMATYELGELRLRAGDLHSADQAFRRAHELGLEPQPGLALLRLAEGHAQQAAASITRALAAFGGDGLRRAHLLPAQVEIALAVGDLATARAAASDLAGIATEFGTTALVAASEAALGAVAATEAKHDAVERLRNASRLWLECEAPYEAARTRLLLAEVLHTRGNASDAALEAQAARTQFERLGAQPDLQRATRVLETIGAGAS